MGVPQKGFKRAEMRVPEVRDDTVYRAYNNHTGETWESGDLGAILRRVSENLGNDLIADDVRRSGWRVYVVPVAVPVVEDVQSVDAYA